MNNTNQRRAERLATMLADYGTGLIINIDIDARRWRHCCGQCWRYPMISKSQRKQMG
jgi:hypothetical protein